MAGNKIRVVRKLNSNANGISAESVGSENQFDSGADEFATGTGTETRTETGTEAAGTETGTEAGAETESGQSASDVIDPLAVQQFVEEGQKKKRGRKPGSKNKSKSEPQKVALNLDVNHLLVTMHVGIAALLKTPELAEVDTDDMQLLRERFADMSKAYGWKTVSVDPRLLATISLAETVAVIYGPRLKRARDRKRKQHLNGAQSPTPINTAKK